MNNRLQDFLAWSIHIQHLVRGEESLLDVALLAQLRGIHLERLGGLTYRARMRLLYPIVLELEDRRRAEAGILGEFPL